MKDGISFTRYPHVSEEHLGFSRSAFSRLLRESLISRYGKLPSAAFVAREFNIRAYGCEPVTQESARRWLRGLSIPTGNKLGVLQAWLKFDLNQLFTPASNHQGALLEHNSFPKTNGQTKDYLSEPPQLGSNQEECWRDEFFEIWSELSLAQRSALFVIAHQLRETTSNIHTPQAQFVTRKLPRQLTKQQIKPSKSNDQFQ
jgi:hypothetical protein